MAVLAGVFDILLTLVVYQFNVPVALCFTALGVILIVGAFLEMRGGLLRVPQVGLAEPRMPLPGPGLPMEREVLVPAALPSGVASLDDYRNRAGETAPEPVVPLERPAWPGA